MIARAKIKLIAINLKVLFCRKQDSIVNGIKSGYSFNNAKKILMPSSVLFAVKRKAFHIKKNFWFFSLLQEPFERLSQMGMNESWKLESPLKISYFWVDVLYDIFIFLSASLTIVDAFDPKNVLISLCLTANKLEFKI